MSCEIKSFTGETESDLAKYLTEHINNGDTKVTEEDISYFRSDRFKNEFGDYEEAFKSGYTGDYASMKNRVDEKGEPKLKFNETAQKHYYLDKDFKEVYYPLVDKGLRGLLNYKQIESLTSTLALEYFKASNLDFNNIDFKSGEKLPNLKAFIKSQIDAKYQEYNSSTDRPTKVKGIVVNQLNKHIDELEENVNNFFKQVGVSFHQEESEEENTNPEETTKDPAFGINSAERDSKAAVSTNIKLKLSLLPSDEVDKLWNTPKYLEFSKVYSTLLEILTDKTDLVGEDVWDLYKQAIGNMKSKKPFLSILEDLLTSEKFQEKDVNEFVQAFRLNKNNHLQSDVKTNDVQAYDDQGQALPGVTKKETDKEGNLILKHDTISVSDAGSKTELVKEKWFNGFKDKYLTLEGTPTKEALGKIQSNLKAFNTLRNMFNKVIDNPDYSPEKVDSIINSYIKGLSALGFDMSTIAFENYLDNYGKNLSDEFRLNQFKDALDFTISAIMNIETAIAAKDFFSVNKLFTSSLNLLQFAKSEAFFQADGSDSSVRQAGKNLYVYSYPSYISKKVREWKKSTLTELNKLKENKDIEKGETLLDQLLNNSEYSKGSFLLQYLTGRINEDGSVVPYLKADKRANEIDRLTLSQDRMNKYDVGLFNQLSYDSAFSATTELSMSDYIKDDVQKVLKNSFSRTITPADKGSEFNIKTGLRVTGIRFDEDQNIITNTVKKMHFGYFASEYNRMIEAHNEIAMSKDGMDLVPHYHYKYGSNPMSSNGNAFKSQYYERLSPGTTGLTATEARIHELLYTDGKPSLDKLTLTANEELTDLMLDYIQDELLKNVEITTRSLVANDILEVTEDGYKIKNIDSNIIKEYNDKFSEHGPSAAALALATDYYTNSVLNLIEYSKLFTGDVAYYKNAVDFKKRVPATYTDGLQLRVKPGEETFKIAAIKAIQRPSPFLEELRKVYTLQNGQEVGLGEVAKHYESINSADAQAWITPERWAFLIKGLGKWTTGKDSYESVYKKMQSKTPVEYTEKELKLAAQPLKGVYFGRTSNGKPVFLKYSQAVLTEQMIQGQDLEHIYKKMKEKGVDETITFDGVKVGAITPTVIHDANGKLLEKFDLNPMALNNREWKLQQDLPTKTFKDTDVGSQIQKNIFAGLVHNRTDENFFLDGNYVSGEHVIDQIVQTVTGLTNNGLNRLKKEFGVDKNYQMSNVRGFYNTLISDLEARGGSKNVIDALKAEIALPGIPQAGSKLVNIFTSIVNDRLIKIKTNGGSFIQMSNFGLNHEQGTKQGVKWAPYAEETTNEPKLYVGEDGRVKVQPGGILISASFLAKSLPNWKSLSPEELFGKYENGVLVKKGAIDPKILDNIIGYRIPNQGLASNDALRIVGILPEGQGDTVVAYTGITTKTGSDFDIDKMYMMFPHFSTVYGKTDAIYDHVKNKMQGKTASETLANYVELLNKFADTEDQVDLRSMKNEFYKLEDNKARSAFFKENQKKIIDLLLDPANKELPFVKEIVKELDIKPKGIKYTNSQSGTSEGLSNRLIELYKSVLTNPVVYKKVMSPIDIPFIENEVNMIKPDAKSENALTTFDPIKDIELRYSFLGGKAGVGMEANALVDISRPGTLSLNKEFIGWGNKNASGFTEFDQEYSESLSAQDLEYYVEEMRKFKGEDFNEADFRKSIEKVPISDSLTAILNAFVDIAKDPYITKGNWTTITTNVGNLLIRAGMHPLMVTNFMAQPIIGDYIKFKQNLEGLGNTLVGDTDYAFKKDSVVKALNEIDPSYGILYTRHIAKLNVEYKMESANKDLEVGNITKEEFDKLVEPLTKPRAESRNAIMKSLKNTEMTKEEKIAKTLEIEKILIKEHDKVFNPRAISLNQSLEYYRNQNLKGRDNEFQWVVYNKFQDLVKTSQVVRENILVSKLDTSGAGKNINSLYSIANMYDYIVSKEDEKGALKGFESKFEGTTLEAYYNSLKEVIKIVQNNPKLFPQGTAQVQDMFNEISQNIEGKSAVNEKLMEALEIGYNSYLMSNMFNISQEEANDLFAKFPARFQEFAKTNKDKYFMLEDLVVKARKKNKKGQVDRITLNNRKKDQYYEKAFTDSWNDLFLDNPKIAEDLVKYAFMTSGFQMNSSQFFTYIPHQYMIKRDINEFISKFTDGSVGQGDFIDLFFRNNLDNTKYVKSLPKKTEVSPVSKVDSTSVFKINDLTSGMAKYYVLHEGKPFKLQGFTGVDNEGIYHTPIYVEVKTAATKLNDSTIPNYSPFKNRTMYNVSDDILQEVSKQIIQDRTGNTLIDPTKKVETAPEVIEEPVVLPTTKVETPITGFKPANAEQANAVDAIQDFIKNGNPKEFFTLEGKAGTGKTTIVQEAIAPFVHKQPIVIAALAHKAKTVLQSKLDSRFGKETVPGYSTAALLGMKMNEETGEFEIDEYARKVPIKGAKIIIIDESSMISQEALDLIMENKRPDAKVIFLGDTGQLPPIGDSQVSPTFNTANKAKLLERVRQGEESPILPFADLYWNNAHAENPVQDPSKGVEKKNVVSEKGSLVFAESALKVLPTVAPMFKEAVEKGDPNFIKYVVYRNNIREKLNAAIRNEVFGEEAKTQQYLPGELIQFNNNFSISEYDQISNATEAVVVEATPSEEGKQFKTWDLVINVDGKQHLIQALDNGSKAAHKAFVSELFAEARKLTGLEKKAAFSRAWYEAGKYAPIDYSYAITSHKSQGSTYNTVIVSTIDINSVTMTTNAEKSRSIYTAITRASQTAIILDGTETNMDDLNTALSYSETTPTVKEEVKPVETQEAPERVNAFENYRTPAESNVLWKKYGDNFTKADPSLTLKDFSEMDKDEQDNLIECYGK